MSPTSARILNRTLLTFALLVSVFVFDASAQRTSLGSVDFPTSGSAKAQAHFLRGLAALHSFWYEEALEEFRLATEAQPDFAMGYWGEAMGHNHPLWSEQDADAARRALGKIGDTTKLTPRERAYIEAVKILYGEGDKAARDKAYASAMEKLHRDHPGDLEAASFYALSLLGAVRPGDKGFLRQMRAGAIALDVYEKNPNHPGAAHYIIHAFDDPEHAVLALPAARRYAEIAPEAHHARHMPSHIFLQLGMWPEAAASNESAWDASESWVKRKNLSPALRDYHSLHWLLYVYLQQGRFSKAEELLTLMRGAMEAHSGENKFRPNYYESVYASMAATYIVETERWDMTEKLFEPLNATERRKPSEDTGGATSHGAHCSAGAPASSPQNVTTRSYGWHRTLPAFTRALASAVKSGPETGKHLELLKSMAGMEGDSARDSVSRSTRALEINALEVSAAEAASRGRLEEAIEQMKRATTLEDDMPPPSGPPTLIKPSHELYGEILLSAGRTKEAAEQFARSLTRQPNRARSLLGAARAAARSGDEAKAAEHYSTFLKQWQHGDANLAELREARGYVEKAENRSSASATSK